MECLNLSALPLGKLRSWLPNGLEAEKVVFLPDACPGKSPLPTGTAVLLKQPDWRRFAVSDCGCGMRLLRAAAGVGELSRPRWDAVAERLKRNKGRSGDLGGGNHFLDALEPYGEDRLHFLIHTGSRDESGLVDGLVGDPERFDREFARVVDWARENRAEVQRALEAEFGPMEVALDMPHNTYEELPGGAVIIRKGAVRLAPGETTVIPSNMSGDVALVRASEAIGVALNSMSHGTGRLAARGESKRSAQGYDFEALRRAIMMPDCIRDSSLRSEGPYAYRDLDGCLDLIKEYVEVVERFAVIGYMGHL